jgi:queuosine precursor transporter
MHEVIIMFNVYFGVLFIFIHFILVLFAYRQFGKLGLFVWIAIASVLANIQVVKAIEIFTLQATLGNTLYGSIFLATDILNEKYTKKDAQQSVMIGFLAVLTYLITMQMALVFQPAGDEFALTIQSSFELIFGLSFRIVIGSLVAYFVSQFLDIALYSKIKQKLFNDRWLWLRNNGSTLISQLFDTGIFVFIAFYGLDYSLIDIFITTYILKVLIAVADTPFIYLSKKIKPKRTII